MRKSSNAISPIAIAIAGTTIGAMLLWLAVAHSAGISFVYRGKWDVLLAVAYGSLSLVSIWILVRGDSIQKAWVTLSKSDRACAIAGLVVGPLLLSNILFLLIPWLGNGLADQAAKRAFTYVSSEPYARTSRGLVQLKLVDENGGEHLVVFKKERVDGLAMKCGDTLATVGRNSFLGYVIDSEARASDPAKQCPQG